MRTFLAFVLAFCVASPSLAATAVGAVSRVQGQCTGAIEGNTRVLAPDAPVHLAEELSTGARARLAVALDDGTALTLGENAQLVIDDFVYDPSGSRSLGARVSGAFRYVSGMISRVQMREVRLTTPVAVISARGTDFWSGPIDGVYGVALFEGVVAVTANGVTTVLDTPGSGINLALDGTPTGPVTQWPQEKLDRALAAVAFE